MAYLLRRISALETRLNVKECGEVSCVKCALAKLHYELYGGALHVCDGRPATLTDFTSLSDAQLEQGIADLRAVTTVRPEERDA